MAGWNLKIGKLNTDTIEDETLWRLFNYVFSNGCKKRNTYKHALIKSLLDNLFNVEDVEEAKYLSLWDVFFKFTENYWNLVIKYDLKQMRPDAKSDTSKIESVIKKRTSEIGCKLELQFCSIDDTKKNQIVSEVLRECKKYVLGALYSDFEGKVYGFNIRENGIYINESAYRFMLKYKTELEQLNYYSWAKFLETVNDVEKTYQLLDKLELATPKRNDLSVYHQILKEEFKICNCFYCGKRLNNTNTHVDHFIPWSFIKEDKMWNFVLSCSTCNGKKNNMLPTQGQINKIIKQNAVISQSNNQFVRKDFVIYNDDLIEQLWEYAYWSGYKPI